MAIREGALKYFEADTDAEIPASIHSPSIVVALDTGEYYLMFNGRKKKMSTDATAVTAGFASTAAAMTILSELNSTAITTA